jgi:hypothetical protein
MFHENNPYIRMSINISNKKEETRDDHRPSDYPFDLGLMKDSDELGILSFSTTAVDSETKEALLFWLQHGLIWYYAFNHEEAVECFEKALSIDKNCAMAHWGISMSHGPNYNNKFMSRDSFPSALEAYAHAIRAKELSCISGSTLSSVELDLIEALAVRFNQQPTESGEDQISQNTLAFSVAMKKVYNKHQSNPCVICIYAECLMNFSPWRLWDLDSGQPIGQTTEILQMIEAGLTICPKHPGLNHFMVHVCEMCPSPDRALPSCAELRTIAPDAGHLVHMSSHIYALLGMWQEAVNSNTEAQVADDKYVLWKGAFNFYAGYRMHDMHFIAYSAMFCGTLL